MPTGRVEDHDRVFLLANRRGEVVEEFAASRQQRLKSRAR